MPQFQITPGEIITQCKFVPEKHDIDNVLLLNTTKGTRHQCRQIKCLKIRPNSCCFIDEQASQQS